MIYKILETKDNCLEIISYNSLFLGKRDNTKKEITDKDGFFNYITTIDNELQSQFSLAQHIDNHNYFTKVNKSAERDYVRESRKRTITNMVNLARVNSFNVFITNTYENNNVDRKKDIINFRNYQTRLKKSMGKDITYLDTIEFQKRGAIHHHTLMKLPVSVIEKIPYLETIKIKGKKIKKYYFIVDGEKEYLKLKQVKDYHKLNETFNNKYWKRGFSQIIRIVDSSKISNYMTKYLTKSYDTLNTKNKLNGIRLVRYSQNLIKWKDKIKYIALSSYDLNRILQKKLSKGKIYGITETEYQGKIKYYRLNTTFKELVSDLWYAKWDKNENKFKILKGGD